MSRYLERAEHTARVMNVQLNLMLERGAGSDERHWERVLEIAGTGNGRRRRGQLRNSLMSTRSVIHRACIMAARENARQVREQISSEMWEQLNRLFHAVQSVDPEHRQGDARDFLQAIKDGSHLFQGITDSTMTHGEGWQFIQAGRYLERAFALSTLVSVHFREFYWRGWRRMRNRSNGSGCCNPARRLRRIARRTRRTCSRTAIARVSGAESRRSRIPSGFRRMRWRRR